MALIIKADMPICCDRCFYSSRCFTYSQTVQKLLLSEHEQMFDVFGETRLHDCPILGEIPDEHGDLGDLSELSMTLYSELETQTPKTLGEVMQIIKKVFDDAPTVLEASNG